MRHAITILVVWLHPGCLVTKLTLTLQAVLVGSLSLIPKELKHSVSRGRGLREAARATCTRIPAGRYGTLCRSGAAATNRPPIPHHPPAGTSGRSGVSPDTSSQTRCWSLRVTTLSFQSRPCRSYGKTPRQVKVLSVSLTPSPSPRGRGGFEGCRRDFHAKTPVFMLGEWHRQGACRPSAARPRSAPPSARLTAMALHLLITTFLTTFGSGATALSALSCSPG